MILVDHSQRVAVPLTPRQRRTMQAVAGLVAIAAVVVVVLLSTEHSTSSRGGCVNVVVAGATGGQVLHSCGAAARAFCKTEFRRHDPVALSAQPQCRLAGLGPARSATRSSG